MTCIRCKHDTARRFGTFGKLRIQRYRCSSCRKTFSDPRPKVGSHYTNPEKAAQALTMMLEGMSIRAISRITGMHKNTILALMLTAADRARLVFNTLVRNVRCRRIQADEVWCFVGKKQRHVRASDSPEMGDAWLFVALDPDTKLLASYTIGKRTRETTFRFLTDLKARLADERFQLTTDGFHFYERGVEDVFAGQADFAQLVKLYGDYGQHGNERYSPGPIIEVISKVRDGRPDPKYISTSHVERGNLTLRMALRRYTRLTNAHSKKLSFLEAAVAIYAGWYNFVRVHASLRCTPAMESGLTDHVWTVAELLGAA